MSALENSQEGKTFELLFERQCHLAGLYPDKNHLKAKRAWKGKLQALESNLDFTVMDKAGRVGFFDCKSFEGTYFTHSMLKLHQRKLAALYNEWSVPAGFVVWLRETKKVFYYSGSLISHIGPGSRFDAENGIALGTWDRFDVVRIMSPGLIFRSQTRSQNAI